MDKKWPAWIVLGLIALIAGCALGLTNEVTAPVIKEQALAAAMKRAAPSSPMLRILKSWR